MSEEESKFIASTQAVHIGQLIERVFRQSGLTQRQLAERINCERSNVARIFKRDSIDIKQLLALSLALEHNFLGDLMQKNSEDDFLRLLVNEFVAVDNASDQVVIRINKTSINNK